MKSRIFISIYFLSALVSSLIFAQNPQFDFPLQIGNRWQYSEGHGPYSESRAIKDTILPNGLNYTQVVGDLFSGFFRKEGSKIFSYSTLSDTEYVKYDFSLRVGDTLQVIIRDTDTTLITVYSAGTMTIFGTERNYMTFFRDNLPSTGDGGDVIADGLGFVQYFGEVMFYGLTGAVINGVEYGVILDVATSDKNIPTDFRLLQNYPNPFNPSTTIAFEINIPGYVKMNIYDLLGNQVTTLLNEYKNTGIHQVIFYGENLSSGIYFYTITFNNIIKTKSMVLLK